mgnify:CR=1 FL=1
MKDLLGKVNELLENAVDDVDDPEVRFELRSAQQLLPVVQQRHDDLGQAIEDAGSDKDVLDSLRSLGYAV